MIPTSGRRSCAPTGWPRSPTCGPASSWSSRPARSPPPTAPCAPRWPPCSGPRKRARGCSRSRRSRPASRATRTASRCARRASGRRPPRAAGEAEVAAAAAIKLSAASRDAAAEARLSDREGSVEGRRPQDLIWSDRERDAVLTEEERLRTLSRSSAQITFRDDSRLRLNANSQAVIRRMRTDPLSRTEEAKVSLVEGDFYALLAGKTDRKKFEVQVPEVTTDVESRNFWVRRDDSGSKFTNFDEGVLRVAANGSAVDLGRNEGTLVRNGRQPTEKVGILGAVGLQAPADDSQTFAAEADLRWAPVADAVGYWLELAHDQGFERMAISRWGLKDTTFATGPLEIGSYYWRIAALDRFGLPGARGEVWRFHVRVDQMPPFLTIQRPAEGELIRTGPIGIEGEAEKGGTAAPGRRRPAARRGGPVPGRGRPEAGRGRAGPGGDRPRGQPHRAAALIPVCAGRAGGAAVRRRDPAAGARPLRHRRRRDLAHRHDRPGRAAAPGRRRPAAARIDLRRRQRPVHAERAAARGRQRVRRRRGPALGVHQPRRLPGLAGPRPARNCAGSRRPRPRPRSSGWGCAAGCRAQPALRSTAGRRG